jgi:hypothetical protein
MWESLPLVSSNTSIAWLAILFSCATPQRGPESERSSASQTHASGEALASGSPPKGGSEPQRAAIVRIVNVAPGRFLLEADARAEVAATATLERRSTGGRWVPTPHGLRDSCAPPAGGVPECRVLSAGAPFSPLSWNGTPCGPCCSDQDPTPIESGTYRLALTACKQPGVRWDGPSFDMPAATDAVERWRATSNVRKVSLFKLSSTRQEDASDRDERHIADYPIVSGAEVVLSESMVVGLVAWLRNPGAFSDALMPRCFPGEKFGFRVERDLPGIGQERSDIAVDLGCQSIVVINQEGDLRSKFYTYFGNSRQALLEILRNAMPTLAVKSPQR